MNRLLWPTELHRHSKVIIADDSRGVKHFFSCIVLFFRFPSAVRPVKQNLQTNFGKRLAHLVIYDKIAKEGISARKTADAQRPNRFTEES